ncbi:MAG: hypothetical protein II938_04955 [Alphaproteobacteria bacterium]|nr:hypothetical protein [Alphaproteobacteria bacterium]
MFFKMAPDQLCMYCDKHPFYSLPAGVRNYRTKAALAIMEDCAQSLTQNDRAYLAAYVKGTFSRGQIVVAPQMLNSFYIPLFEKPEFKSAPLTKAISEFVGFARAPMSPEKQRWLNEFVDNITPPARKATAFECGMENYRRNTCLFPH